MKILLESASHRGRTIAQIAAIIMPPLLAGQLRVWRWGSRPVALATSAWLDATTETRVLFHDHVPETDHWLKADPDHMQLNLTIPHEVMAETAQRWFGFVPDDSLWCARVKFGGPDSAWPALLEYAARSLTGPGPVAAHAALSRHLEETICVALLRHWAHAAGVSLSAGGRAAAPGYVRRAEEIMAAEAREAPTIGEVAQRVGVSARTLSGGFRRFRGTSPREFLAARRLEGGGVLSWKARLGTAGCRRLPPTGGSPISGRLPVATGSGSESCHRRPARGRAVRGCSEGPALRGQRRMPIFLPKPDSACRPRTAGHPARGVPFLNRSKGGHHEGHHDTGHSRHMRCGAGAGGFGAGARARRRGHGHGPQGRPLFRSRRGTAAGWRADDRGHRLCHLLHDEGDCRDDGVAMRGRGAA